jgi:hypothetical protein
MLSPILPHLLDTRRVVGEDKVGDAPPVLAMAEYVVEAEDEAIIGMCH